jgi:hypothetical protein
MTKRAFAIKFDPSALKEKLSAIEGASASGTRMAAQTGIQTFYDEVRLRVPVGKKEFHWFYGKYQRYPQNSGDLKRAVYQAFSEDRSVPYMGMYTGKQQYTKATYHVTWRHKNAGGFRGAPYGFMVEFGTSRAPAHPFLRPSFDAKRVEALTKGAEAWKTEVRKEL